MATGQLLASFTGPVFNRWINQRYKDAGHVYLAFLQKIAILSLDFKSIDHWPATSWFYWTDFSTTMDTPANKDSEFIYSFLEGIRYLSQGVKSKL